MSGAALPADGLILLVAGMLAIGVAGAAFANRLRAPALLLFLVIGMVVGDDGLAVITFDDPATAQAVASVALVVILFEGGLTTRPRDVRLAAGPGLVLATVGVVVTAAVVAWGSVLLLGVDWTTAALVGAVTASTDAAAVFAVLRSSPLPRRLTSVLELESGANDPMAVMLTVGALEVWRGAPTAVDVVGFAALQLGGGLLVGGLVAVVGVVVLRRLDLGAGGLYGVFALTVAGLAYGVAASLGASGFLAVYVAGLVVGAGVPRHRREIRALHEGLASASSIGLFLLLGILVFPSELPAVTGAALAVAALLVLVARPIAVLVCAPWFRFGWREVVLLSAAGLRGAVPIVLATFPLAAGYPGGGTIFNVVFFVVLVSAAMQGAAIPWLARRLGLAQGAPVWGPVAEVLPLEDLHDGDAELVEVDVTADLAVVGRPLRAMPIPDGGLATTLLRDGRASIPAADTVLRAGDVLLVMMPTREDAAARLTAWARGELGVDRDVAAPGWPA